MRVFPPQYLYLSIISHDFQGSGRRHLVCPSWFRNCYAIFRSLSGFGVLTRVGISQGLRELEDLLHPVSDPSQRLTSP